LKSIDELSRYLARLLPSQELASDKKDEK